MIETNAVRGPWASARMSLEPFEESHIPAVTRIFAENLSIVRWLGPERDPGVLARDAVFAETLPPGGRRDDELGWLIRDNDTGEALGLLQVHVHYPADESAYIGALFFVPDAQEDGRGREIVQAIHDRLQSAGAIEARVAVGLRNWVALRFWLAMGYESIAKVSGDEAYGAGAFASLELVRRIAAPPTDGASA